MRAALIDAGGVVRNIIMWSQGDTSPEGFVAVPLTDADHLSIGWERRESGEWFDPTYRPPTEDEIKAALTAAVQIHVDGTARARGYDSGLSCASYDGDPNAKFDAEAKVFKSWRSSVWTACYAALEAVTAGTSEPPTAEALIASLPVISWPD